MALSRCLSVALVLFAASVRRGGIEALILKLVDIQAPLSIDICTCFSPIVLEIAYE